MTDSSKQLSVEEMEFLAEKFLRYCEPKKMVVIRFTGEDGMEQFGIMRPQDAGPIITTYSLATARALFSLLVLCQLASEEGLFDGVSIDLASSKDDPKLPN